MGTKKQKSCHKFKNTHTGSQYKTTIGKQYGWLSGIFGPGLKISLITQNIQRFQKGSLEITFHVLK